jgi:hypothetical protein
MRLYQPYGIQLIWLISQKSKKRKFAYRIITIILRTSIEKVPSVTIWLCSYFFKKHKSYSDFFSSLRHCYSSIHMCVHASVVATSYKRMMFIDFFFSLVDLTWSGNIKSRLYVLIVAQRVCQLIFDSMTMVKILNGLQTSSFLICMCNLHIHPWPQ